MSLVYWTSTWVRPALLDYDNDSWLDIYLLNGSTFPALNGKEAPLRAMLLHKDDGTFSDVTDKAGVGNPSARTRMIDGSVWSR